MQFWRTIVTFEIRFLKFFKMWSSPKTEKQQQQQQQQQQQKKQKKTTTTKIETKNALFGYFQALNIEKQLTYYTPNFTKCIKFGTKNALCGCFGGYNFEELLPYLKSPPSKISKCKNWCKTKKVIFDTINVLLRYF